MSCASGDCSYVVIIECGSSFVLYVFCHYQIWFGNCIGFLSDCYKYEEFRWSLDCKFEDAFKRRSRYPFS